MSRTSDKKTRTELTQFWWECPKCKVECPADFADVIYVQACDKCGTKYDVDVIVKIDVYSVKEHIDLILEDENE